MGSAGMAACPCVGKGLLGRCTATGAGCRCAERSVLRNAPSLDMEKMKDGELTSSLSVVNRLLERSISFEGGRLLLPATRFCRACYIEEGEGEQLHLLLPGSHHLPAHAHPMDTCQTKLPINSRIFCLRNPSSEPAQAGTSLSYGRPLLCA